MVSNARGQQPPNALVLRLNIGYAALLHSESRDEFDQFVVDWLRVLRPSGAKQEFHAKRIIDLAWRIDRVRKLEAAVLRDARNDIIDLGAHQATNPLLSGPFAYLHKVQEEDVEGAALLRFNDVICDSLPRYERHLARQMRTELAALAQDQAINGRAEEPPAGAPTLPPSPVAPDGASGPTSHSGAESSDAVPTPSPMVGEG